MLFRLAEMIVSRLLEEPSSPAAVPFFSVISTDDRMAVGQVLSLSELDPELAPDFYRVSNYREPLLIYSSVQLLLPQKMRRSARSGQAERVPPCRIALGDSRPCLTTVHRCSSPNRNRSLVTPFKR
jgi:hypothetical protein